MDGLAAGRTTSACYAEEIDPESGAFLGNFRRRSSIWRWSRPRSRSRRAAPHDLVGDRGRRARHAGADDDRARRERARDDADGLRAAARTTVTGNRRKARAIGYVVSFCVGVTFARGVPGYSSRSSVMRHGRSERSWRLARRLHGHGSRQRHLAGRPSAHRHDRHGRGRGHADRIAGFLMLNYGRSTFLVALVAHVAFGAMVGRIVSM